MLMLPVPDGVMVPVMVPGRHPVIDSSPVPELPDIVMLWTVADTVGGPGGPLLEPVTLLFSRVAVMDSAARRAAASARLFILVSSSATV